MMKSTQKPKLSTQAYRAKRRAIGLVSVMIFVLLLLVLVPAQEQSLWHSAFSTGYALIFCLFFLAAYNLRKKLPFWPALGSSRTWMQLHIYVGFGSIAIFLFHIGWRIPTGQFEQFLAALYVIVAGSGLYGLYTTRLVPRRLTAINREVIFEQIPMLRAQLIAQARALILDASAKSNVLAKFYTNHLATFFERPRSVAYLLVPTSRRSKHLIAEINNLDRYLSTSQRAVGEQLVELVQQKEDLDYHYALQGRLKIWLFAHIGFTYGLLITAVLHGIMVHAFGGGLR